MNVRVFYYKEWMEKKGAFLRWNACIEKGNNFFMWVSSVD